MCVMNHLLGANRKFLAVNPEKWDMGMMNILTNRNQLFTGYLDCFLNPFRSFKTSKDV